jgi:hypothetical protein
MGTRHWPEDATEDYERLEQQLADYRTKHEVACSTISMLQEKCDVRGKALAEQCKETLEMRKQIVMLTASEKEVGEANEQLATRTIAAEKQVVMLRAALEAERNLRIFGQSPECGQTHWESIRDMRRAVYDATEEALNATQDLSGYILCDADSVATVVGDAKGNFAALFIGIPPGTSLYMARKP